MRDRKSNAVLAELREHICERQCSKALDFVDVDEKVAPPIRGVYLSLTTPTWAICCAVMSVSHDRLDRVFLYRKRQPGRFLMELLSQPDLNRIEIGLSHAIGTA